MATEIVRQEVRKNVAVIHTSGELSLLERKMSNVFLLQAYDNLIKQRTHTLPLKVLAQLCGYDSKDTEHLKSVLRSLTTTPIEFNLLEDGDDKWSVTPLLSFAELHKGYVTWRYDESMAERLYEPAVYAVINLAMQKRFTSAYAYTLYENCSRYRAVRSTGWWPIDTFKTMMVAKSDTYRDFRRFNEKIIAPAVREINDISDLFVESEFKKAGRGGKVTDVKFHISENPQRALFNGLEEGQADVTQTSAFKALRKVGVSARLATMAVMQDEKWAMTIADTTAQGVESGTVRNAGGYAASLINRGAVVGTPEIVIEKHARDAAAKKTAEEEARRKKYRDLFESERNNAAMMSMTEAKRKELLPKFLELEDRRGNGRYRAMADLEAGRIGGTGLAPFSRFVADTLLGPMTESMLDEYIDMKTTKTAAASAKAKRSARA